MKRISLIIALLFTGLTFGYDANYYSDIDRGLFSLPKSTDVAGSDFVFSRDGTPQVNPANLAFDSLSEISCAYAGFYQNIFSTSVLSYATRITRNSGLGFSLSYLYNPDIPYNNGFNTENINGADIPIYDSSRITYHSESQVFFHVAYGQKYPVISGIEVAAGIGMNAQRYNLSPYRGYGIGCDAGASLDFVRQGLRMALGCENITTNYLRWTPGYSEEALPHAFFGVGWRKEIPYLYGRVQIQFKSLDLLANQGINSSVDSTVDTTTYSRPSLKHFTKDPLYFLLNGTYGLEYTIMNVLALRVGIPVGDSYGTDWSRIAFGCGVNLMKRKLSLDFAYVTHELAGSYQVGLTYYWQNDILGR
jgi:hypothetical protein